MAGGSNSRIDTFCYWTKPFALVGVIGFGTLAMVDRLAAQQPATPAKPQAVAPPPAQKMEPARPVAYLYDSLPLTQEEFGKYQMDRGGAERLETFINIRIIELEAARRSITVTKAEMEADLAKSLEGMAVNHNDFVKVILPKYGKTLFEWMEDVVRPRLLMAKMCKDRVKVSDENLKIQYERLHGEKRIVQMIVFPKGDDANTVAKIRGKIVGDKNEFDSIARGQANPLLGAAAGRVKPISRHMQGEDKRIEETAFRLKPNEVSEILVTDQGYVILKLNEIIPPSDKVAFETEKQKLYAAAFDEQLELEIPKLFATLKEGARPKSMYTGPQEWKVVNPLSTGSITVPGSGGAPAGATEIQPAGGVKK
jgi:hypothetical protein